MNNLETCQGCINCDGTRTLIMASLLKAYQNGLTDIVAKTEGVIPDNRHHLPILNFMADDIMKELNESFREYAAAPQAKSEFVPTYPCPLCNAVANSEEALEGHMAERHGLDL